MINSNKLEDLHPLVKLMAEEFLKRCAEQSIKVKITSTFRDIESQNALYAQGRTTSGKIVTNAKGGQSMHNFRLALDFVPLDNSGNPIWDGNNPLYKTLGDIGKSCGFEWGGDFTHFVDKPHLQYTQGISLSELRDGKMIK